MIKFTHFSLTRLFFSASLIISCGEAGEKTKQPVETVQALKQQEITERGYEIVSQVSTALMQVLNEKIQQQGIEAAIGFCSLQAIPITDSIAKAEQVNISRVSHRPRNPANAANRDELALIGRYNENRDPEQPPAPTVIRDDKGYLFYAPIAITMPLCLNCHGNKETDIQPAVLQTIQELYPNDKATGFAMNDLRGLFRIDFPE